MATIFPPAARDTARKTAAARADFGYALYFMLRITGFMLTTMLMTLGTYVVFFLAIGGFSLDGMMAHLANMADRYVAADAARIAGFKAIAGTTFIMGILAIAFLRRHTLSNLLPGNAGEPK